MTIFRVFNTTEDAKGAVSDLKLVGYRDEAIEVVAQDGGSTLVIVNPPFGATARATNILQRRRPGDTGTPKVDYQRWGAVWDVPVRRPPQVILLNDPTPLSSWLCLPTIFKKPKTLSALLGLPTLL